MLVRDWMTEPAITIRADALIREALEVMRTHRIEHLPVLDTEGRLLGMLDLVNLVGRGSACAPLDDLVALHMEGGALAIHPEAPLSVSAAILQNENRTALPVAAGGYVLGVLSRSDVFTALASTVVKPRAAANESHTEAA